MKYEITEPQPTRNALSLLSVKDAAQLLGVGKTTIYKLLGQRAIDAVKIGRKTLLRVESLERWLELLPRLQSRAPHNRGA